MIRALALAVVLASALSCAAARAILSSQIVSKINAYRMHDGIPAGIVEDRDWSAKCALHNHYAALNGNDTPNPHQETHGKQGYTSGGDWAARHSELGGSSPYFSAFDDGNPFEYAPFHLAGLLNPRVTRVGAAESELHVCVGAGNDPPRPHPATDTVYSHPGNGRSIYWAEWTQDEYPYAPNRLVGLPDNAVTGPNLIVFWDGPQADPLTRLTGATLTGPNGPVGIKTAGVDQGAIVAPSTGFIIPVQPLTPGSRYRATATFENASGSRKFTGTFSFSTLPVVPVSRLVRIEKARTAPAPARALLNLVVHTAFPLNLAGRSCTISAVYSNGDRVGPDHGSCFTNPYGVRMPPAGGSAKVTVTGAPFRIGTTSYPGGTVTKVFAGPARSSVVGRIDYRPSYSYRQIAASGFTVRVEMNEAGSQVGLGLLDGKAVYGASRPLVVHKPGVVAIRVRVSSALGFLVQKRGRATLTLVVRVYPPNGARLDIRKRVTITP